MRVIAFLLLAFLGLCISPSTLYAHDTTSSDSSSHKRTFKELKHDFFYGSPDSTNKTTTGFFMFPLLYYTPDTRFAFGAMGIYYFNIKNKETGEKTRLSYARALADYTLNKQFDAWANWYIFLKDEEYISEGDIRYQNFIDRYYGIGNTTKKEDELLYSYNLGLLDFVISKQVANRFFVGLEYRYEQYINMELESENRVLWDNTNGTNGIFNSGIGTVLLYDTRNSSVNASEGIFFESRLLTNQKFLGATRNFSTLSMKASTYYQFKPKNILAFQVAHNSAWGDVPFTDMPVLGGDNILRGYAKNRFRDNNFSAFQAEYRFPLFWRFGMVTFAGLGDIYNQFTDVSLNTIKYSLGAGLRFTINRAENLNVRMDYGIGRQNTGFYILLTEAF